MLAYWIFRRVCPLSMPIIALVVGGRLIWCTFQLARISRYKLATVAAFGVLLLGGMLFILGFYWFEYEVAQTSKEIWTDLRMDLLAGIPFYGASFALWRCGGLLQAVVNAQTLKR